jgi:predicted Zn-dependent peptidase
MRLLPKLLEHSGWALTALMALSIGMWPSARADEPPPLPREPAPQPQPAPEPPPAPTPAPAPAAAPQVSLPFERYQLDNGLEVILHVDKAAPLIAVNVWYHVGSGDETPGKSGFAHLFEHMMFQGTKHTGNDVHFPILQGLGASSINGTTNYDRTNYFETVPSHHIETALWLESDRMGFLLEALTEQSFRNQVDVVRNERRQRLDNAAYGKARFEVGKSLYPEGHPYRHLVIGLHADLENANLEDVRGFFKTWYVPGNATLAIGGDFDPAAMKALVDKWFGDLPKGPVPARTKVAAPELAATQTIEVPDTFAKLEQVQRTWIGPPALTDEAFPLEVALELLGADGWGRLSKRLTIAEPLCTSVSVYLDGRGHSGEIVVIAQLKPAKDQAKARARVLEILDEEIQKLATEPMSERELARVLVNAESDFVWSLEDLSRRLDLMQYFNHFTKDPGYASTYLERLKKVTAQDAMAAAQRWLTRPHSQVITVPAPAAKPGNDTEAPK